MLDIKESRHYPGTMEAAARVLKVVYETLDQINQSDIIPDTVYIRRFQSIIGNLVCATMAHNANETQAVWRLLSLGDRLELAREVRDNDDASEIDESIVSRYDLDCAGIDWLAAFTEENEYTE